MNTYTIWEVFSTEEELPRFSMLETVESNDNLVTMCKKAKEKYLNKQLRVSDGKLAVYIYHKENEEISFQGLEGLLTQGVGT